MLLCERAGDVRDRPFPAIKESIEIGIKPVCDVLNSIEGVRTVWSCEGHPERPSRPYVTFLAPEATAYQVHRLLGAGRGDGTLQYCWWLIANFRDDGLLQYTIEPNDYRLRDNRHRWWSTYQWNKKAMDAELIRLAVLLTQLRR